LLFRFGTPNFGPVENFLAELRLVRMKLWCRTEANTNSSEDTASHLMAFENAAVISKLLQLSIEYYHHICSNKDNIEEKVCLIPICALRPISSDTEPTTSYSGKQNNEVGSASIDNIFNANGKRLRTPHSEESSDPNTSVPSASSESDQPLSKKPRGGKEYSAMSKDVEDALSILESASQCFRHLDDLGRWVADKTMQSSTSPAFDWASGKRALLVI
jgi:hypothetical protein